MTKEEALEILDTILTIGDQVDALEIAIEALEASINYDKQDKLVLHNDKVIIEPTLYLKKQVYCQLLEEIKKQIESNSSVIILPTGITAKIVRREAVFINGKWEKGETDE